MGLFDKLRDKQEQKAIKENDQKKELAAKNRENVNNTVEKLDNVLNNLGYINSDQQTNIRRLIKTAENELKYSQTIASYDVSEGDKMLGTVADQLAKALKKKDSTATNSALKVIQKALNVRKNIQPYADENTDGMVAHYERILKCGQMIMSIHDKLYDTNTALNSLNKDKTYLDTKIKEDENNVRTLVDSNPKAAAFVEKFNPNGSQKLSDCEGAQELADAYDEFKNTRRRLNGTVIQIGKYNDTARKLQVTIDEQMRVIDTKNTALTAEERAQVDALLKEAEDVLIEMDESSKEVDKVIDAHYDRIEAIGNDPASKMRVMEGFNFFKDEQKRKQRQEEEGRRFQQELERKRAKELENEQVLESENTQRQTITN